VHALAGRSFWRPFAEARAEAADPTAGTPAPSSPPASPPPGKVMTIEEMMRAAKARRAQTEAAQRDAGAALPTPTPTGHETPVPPMPQ
jgi:hypothetical protein